MGIQEIIPSEHIQRLEELLRTGRIAHDDEPDDPLDEFSAHQTLQSLIIKLNGNYRFLGTHALQLRTGISPLSGVRFSPLPYAHDNVIHTTIPAESDLTIGFFRTIRSRAEGTDETVYGQLTYLSLNALAKAIREGGGLSIEEIYRAE